MPYKGLGRSSHMGIERRLYVEGTLGVVFGLSRMPARFNREVKDEIVDIQIRHKAKGRKLEV